MEGSGRGGGRDEVRLGDGVRDRVRDGEWPPSCTYYSDPSRLRARETKLIWWLLLTPSRLNRHRFLSAGRAREDQGRPRGDPEAGGGGVRVQQGYKVSELH